VRANHKQKSSVKDNASHPVWDPDGKMPFVFAVRRVAGVLTSLKVAQTCAAEAAHKASPGKRASVRACAASCDRASRSSCARETHLMWRCRAGP